ncbi:peptidoglycan editing factor PgeF [Macrococcoides canis]|uniref:Purine nucleoside phosphorylase n=2 Tax=Macrococcoides canis TaxID=1855823 RepID=A0A4R6C678_9STAP|nr:peptidoglycan editing factor PgeF [Macrococcus canis]TDM21991.1 peptidoglycan editing factor PgeF [Macrococcus canis]TDM37899.1 peptidoglycan editing factor PgeF [Macrococcus canis]
MMDIFKRKAITFNYKDDEHIIGITGRNGGVSDYPEHALNMARYIEDAAENVSQNQQRVALEIGFDTTKWVFPIQKHGNHIKEVSQKDSGVNINELTEALDDVDGLYTYDKDVLLTMCFADCVPIYIYSERDAFIALGHAGWRGTVGLITEKLIDVYKGDKTHLHCVIGPSISGKAYVVNDEIKAKFISLDLNLEDCFVQNKDMHEIDLKEINRRIALNAGISAAHIHVSQRCTSTESDAFFSYRKEKGNTGRMLAYIGKRDTDGSEKKS